MYQNVKRTCRSLSYSLKPIVLRRSRCRRRRGFARFLFNDNGNDNATKQNVQLAVQWLCTCVLHFGTFLCRSLQNNDVKLPNSRFYGERGEERGGEGWEGHVPLILATTFFFLTTMVSVARAPSESSILG